MPRSYARYHAVTLIFNILFLDAELSDWSPWSSYSPCDENCLKYRQRFCSNGTNCENANEYGVETEKQECKKDATECYGKI